MAQVVVAASIDNELQSKDIAELKKLKQAGHAIDLFYYLPQVPAEFSVLPSVNSELMRWKSHGLELLNKVGTQLGVPEEHRHFIDEVLGPDRVFDAAKALDAKMILTAHPEDLKQRFLSRVFDRLLGSEPIVKVAVGTIDQFAANMPVIRQAAKQTNFESQTKDDLSTKESYSSVWTKESQQKITGKGAKLNKRQDSRQSNQDDEHQEDNSYKKK